MDWKIDIGMSGTMLPVSKCVYTPLAADRLVVITPNTAPYAAISDGKFPAERLQKENMIVREAGSGTRLNAEAFLEKSGIAPSSLNVVAELADTESIKKSVSQGLGVAIVSDRAVEDYCQFGKVLAFDFTPPFPPRQLYLIHHKSRRFSPQAKAFYSFAADYFPK